MYDVGESERSDKRLMPTSKESGASGWFVVKLVEFCGSLERCNIFRTLSKSATQDIESTIISKWRSTRKPVWHCIMLAVVVLKYTGLRGGLTGAAEDNLLELCTWVGSTLYAKSENDGVADLVGDGADLVLRLCVWEHKVVSNFTITNRRNKCTVQQGMCFTYAYRGVNDNENNEHAFLYICIFTHRQAEPLHMFHRRLFHSFRTFPTASSSMATYIRQRRNSLEKHRRNW